MKSTSYAENVVALAEAARHAASEAIFANLAGHLCEGTGSNVFYVVDCELRTPTLDAGCLAGISRALLLEWYGGREVDEPIEVLERQWRSIGIDSPARGERALSRSSRPDRWRWPPMCSSADHSASPVPDVRPR